MTTSDSEYGSPYESGQEYSTKQLATLHGLRHIQGNRVTSPSG